MFMSCTIMALSLVTLIVGIITLIIKIKVIMFSDECAEERANASNLFENACHIAIVAAVTKYIFGN